MTKKDFLTRFFDWLFSLFGFVPYNPDGTTGEITKLVKLIAALEGKKNSSYKDLGGLWTVGVGHLIADRDPKLLKLGIDSGQKDKLYLTDQQCYQLLQYDLDDFRYELDRLLRADVSTNEYDALLSLAFNVGITNFRSSTLLALLNTGEYINKAALAAQFIRWNKVNSRVVSGLTVRRVAEANIFLGYAQMDTFGVPGLSQKSLTRIQQLIDVYNNG